MTLRDLRVDRYKFYFPDDNPISEIISPAFKSAERFDCAVGYFSSSAFKGIAHGLASYINNSDEPLRLLISPYLHPNEIEMIENYDEIQTEQFIFEKIREIFLKGDNDDVENALEKHTKECFAYLLSEQRLQVRVVFQKEGMFHPKLWFWHEGDDVLMLSGSANMTNNALFQNTELLTLDYSWDTSEIRVSDMKRSIQKFEDWFENGPDNSKVFDLPDAICEGLVEKYQRDTPPTEEEAERARAEDPEWESLQNAHARINLKRRRNRFRPPNWANWEEGEFQHQGAAIKAWEEKNRIGILEMATGSGKTITALIASWKLWQETENLFIWIAVPTKPLVDQWMKECEKFGLQPVLLNTSNASKAARALSKHKRGLKNISVFVSTTNFILNEDFNSTLKSNDGEVPILIIGDEVHNFGTERILNALSETIDYRLGLSATPYVEHEYERNENLVSYFGDVCYEFTLKKAITNKCLVPYKYFLHEVQLTEAEMEDYEEVSAQIREKSYLINMPKEEQTPLQTLLNQRRKIMDNAELKAAKFEELIKAQESNYGKVTRTIVFASGKGPEQLEITHEALRRMNITHHRITQEETKDLKKVQQIIESFREGTIGVITAKLVVDEGFNVPEIEVAYLLSSTTVERQWTQRRGRVLRLSPSTNKEFAVIHDFLVLPPNGNLSEEGISMIRRELSRCQTFWFISDNVSDFAAATEAIERAQSLIN